MAKGYIDEEEGVVGVIPTPDGGTKGGYPIPKGVTPFPKGGQPPTANHNAEPGSLLSSTSLANDPQADIDKCQGEINPKGTSTLGSNEENRSDTPTRDKSDEDETVTKGSKQSLRRSVLKWWLWLMRAVTVFKWCLWLIRAVTVFKWWLWPMRAVTGGCKWWLPLIVLIFGAPPSAAISAFTNITGPTQICAGCTLQLRCENSDAKDLRWFQGWGSDKRFIKPFAGGRYEIDGPSRSRPSGVLSSTLKIRNVSEEDSGTFSCYDGKGHSGSMEEVQVLPRISCGSFTPPDDMWVEYHCDHVTFGCKNNSGSWSLQCLNGTWQGQYGPCHAIGISCGSFTPPDDMWAESRFDHVTVGCKNNSGSWYLLCLNDTWRGQYGPCHAIERPNDYTTQIVVVSSTVVIVIGVGVVVVVTCKRRR